ncbi:serine hydroxymethyltransferase [Bacteroidota bacterium]|nr:serine hydroxymethyltransferase [Bacteroidota bacterium]MEC8097212.1 serine hydroxymethyltransferase [Pseudomonadota bacterium]|tara:strand:- start:2947 stop:4212 length:1266 start_codon:yes stop_codon:yes gene_type:complete
MDFFRDKLDVSIDEYDKELSVFINAEKERQEKHIELIASENYASKRILEAQGSVLTNKYAEGYPAKRYYGGCEFVDGAENLAIERAKSLFKAKFANVQPHSGASANAAVFLALLEPGDTVLGMALDQGGHLTHGSKVNFSGRNYNSVQYGLDNVSKEIDYDQVQSLAEEHKPKLIIAGFSAYMGIVDWKKFREIADSVSAYLLVDMAHVSGLVAAEEYPSPIPHAHVVTSTTHKSLRGPRSGIILSNEDEDFQKKLNFGVFPGTQGGPLMHVIAAKAICFMEAMTKEFKDYQKEIKANATVMCSTFQDRGFLTVSRKTENHLVLLDLTNKDITGKDAEDLLGSLNITVNKNSIPNDPQSPFVTSGIRIGTPAITTRGFKNNEAILVANLICDAIEGKDQTSELDNIKKQVDQLCKNFPVYR